jgi:cytochrome c-type biogenesis protein CcmH/NrfG
MLEIALLLAVVVVVAVAVARPLLVGDGARSAADDERDAAELRHRIALEALRDVEVDRRAGSLDQENFLRRRGEAEAHAALTLTSLDAVRRSHPSTQPRPGARRLAGGIGLGLIVLLLAAYALPEPATVASQTVVDERLAAQIAAEEAREQRITELRGRLMANPEDREALAGLADAHLEGSSPGDLQAAAQLLIFLIRAEPSNADAHRKLATAYIRADDYAQASEVTDALEAIEPGSPDVAFLRGLIALRTGELETAVESFDRFLELAPDDERVPMVRELREEAASGR